MQIRISYTERFFSPLLAGWSEASFLLAYATRGEEPGVRFGKTQDFPNHP